MRIFITGGAGFIGSHLAEACLERGDEVYILDDLSTGSLQNLAHLQEDPRYSNRLFVDVNTILNKEAMLNYVGICDVVYHLAAAVGVQYIIDNPLTSIVTNVRGTENILELCARFKKKVVLASTSEAYGKHDHAPLRETDDSVFGPSAKSRWSYAAGKLMDEFTGIAYHRTYDLPVITVRLFNTVGPKQTGRYGMVIPRFVRQALMGDPITVYGDGTQTRTFTHVKEVVKALLLLVESPRSAGEVVNIGGVEEVSILQLAQRIIEMTDSKSTVKLIPYDQAYPRDFEDMLRRVPSTDKLHGLTGFAPSMKLDEILQDVVDYFRSSTHEKEELSPNEIPKKRSVAESRPSLS